MTPQHDDFIMKIICLLFLIGVIDFSIGFFVLLDCLTRRALFDPAWGVVDGVFNGVVDGVFNGVFDGVSDGVVDAFFANCPSAFLEGILSVI